MHTNKETYDQFAISVNIQFKGVWINDSGLLPVKHSKTYLYTEYNGKCLVYDDFDNIPPKNYLQFIVPKNESYFVMVLPPGEEIFLIFQHWLNVNPAIKDISSDTIINVKR